MKEVLPEPPYAADTRAKGWRFELDYEQIEQSSTWALAAPEARPWLLMIWFTAWKQVPCGSLPAEESVIAALIGMAPKAWAKHRAILLRGWDAAPDGRLYHDTLAKRVREMMARRRSDADRQATKRAKEAAEAITAESDGSPTGITAESDGSPTGITTVSRVTPTGLTRESSTGTDNRIPTKKTPKPPLPVGRFPEFWAAWPKSPRKGGKPDCLRHWQAKDLDREADVVIAHVRALTSTEGWTKQGGEFVPAPVVYLRGRRWDGAELAALPGSVDTPTTGALARMAADRMTPEQKAAADKARVAAMEKFNVTRKAVA